MACDCGCTDTSVNCNCPAPLVIEGAQLAYITTTTFSGVPVNIYNGGVGYNTNLYTNSGTKSHFVIIDTNTYITSDNTHTLTTYYTLNGAVGEANANSDGVMRYTSAPIKITASHYTAGVVLTPGQSLWFNMVSGDSTARANWLTAFIYIYEI